MMGVIAHVGLLVAAAHSGPLGRAAGNHLLHQHAGIDRQAHLRGQIRSNRIGHDAQRGPLDAPVAGQVGQHGLGRVDGNGKADARTLVGAVGGDHRVDADHLAARVQQRAAGVAGIDGRVGLDGVFDRRAFSVSEWSGWS